MTHLLFSWVVVQCLEESTDQGDTDLSTSQPGSHRPQHTPARVTLTSTQCSLSRWKEPPRKLQWVWDSIWQVPRWSTQQGWMTWATLFRPGRRFPQWGEPQAPASSPQKHPHVVVFVVVLFVCVLCVCVVCVCVCARVCVWGSVLFQQHRCIHDFQCVLTTRDRNSMLWGGGGGTVPSCKTIKSLLKNVRGVQNM